MIIRSYLFLIYFNYLNSLEYFVSFYVTCDYDSVGFTAAIFDSRLISQFSCRSASEDRGSPAV